MSKHSNNGSRPPSRATSSDFSWLPQDQWPWSTAFVLMSVVWFFSVLVRLNWIGDATQIDSFMWNGVPLVTTNDSYLFGSIAQKAIGGTASNVADCPGILDHGMITVLLFVAAKWTGLSVDALMIWLPVFIGGIVAIPVFLIGRLFGSTLWGFCAGLLASVAQSYYNRTMAGYFDTDMLSITMPAFALYCLLAAHRKESFAWLTAGSATLFIYPFFYFPGVPIAYALALTFVGFRLLTRFRHPMTWQSFLLLGLAVMILDGSTGRAVAHAPLLWFVRAAILCAASVILQKTAGSMQAPWRSRFVMAACVLTCLGVIGFSEPIKHIGRRTSEYIGARSELLPQSPADGLNFFKAGSLVVEAQTANSLRENIVITARRVSGSFIGGILAIAGFVLLVFHAREFAIALPFVGFAYLAMQGGERFTIHAVPIGALSATAICFWLPNLMMKKAPGAGKMIGLAVCSLLLFANLQHVAAYKTSPVLDSKSVATLAQTAPKSDAGDYLITWWDYGTAAWYYSGLNTVCNPGNQNSDIYLVAKILNSPSQALAANLAKVAIETHAETSPSRPVIRRLLKPHVKSIAGLDGFFSEVSSTNYLAPAKTRETYLFLNHQMLNFIPAMRLFSERDLLTGEPHPSRTFISFNDWKSDGQILQATRGAIRMQVDRKNLQATLDDGRQFALNNFDYIPAAQAGRLSIKRQSGHPTSPFRLVIREEPPLCILMEEDIFHSNFVQMYLYESFDAERFERVAGNPYAIMYRVK